MSKKKIQTQPLASDPLPIENIEGSIAESSEEAPPKKALKEEVVSLQLQDKPTTSKTKSTTCPNCKKSMLQTTFKYYHSLKCHPPTQTKTHEVRQSQPPQSKPETQAHDVVEFGISNKMQLQRDKYSNLFSKAF